MAMSAKAEEQNSHSRIFQSEAVTRRSIRRLSRIAKGGGLIAHHPELKLRELKLREHR
jgi:hypothetical protein